MPNRSVNVLFLCTGNTARSQMAEALLNYHGKGRFKAFSAGSKPCDEVHPSTLRVLKMYGVPTNGLRPKLVSEFEGDTHPPMDAVIALCDTTDDACPVWQRTPVKGHWHIADPVAYAKGDPENIEPFLEAFLRLEMRVKSLVAMPMIGMSDDSKSKAIDALAV